jgi:anthranilate synthase component 1
VTERCFAVAEASAPQLLEELAAAALSAPELDAAAAVPARHWHEDAPAAYQQMVTRAQLAIAAGDIYQANLSRAWHAELGAEVADVALYQALRAANPAPFAAWWQQPELRLMSSSPERLVRIVGERIETRPIAGTRPRSRDPQRQNAELGALLASAKERAEHVMLIDLERNDLGRVCAAGTVRVDDYMVTETYQHVHHIVSGVSGHLRPDCSPVDAIRAVFPGGTITGCPKFRCMQLIGELEGTARGAYTGSVGYLNRDGSMDLNILIRTLVRNHQRVELRAGAGIVADSDWQHELQETRAKARGLLHALGVRV